MPERLTHTARILVAPNAYKGSLHCFDAAEAMAAGIHSVLPQAHVDQLPIADGGDCTMDVLARAAGGETFEQTVTGPLGSLVGARWAGLVDGRTAVIESAEASGLRLLLPGQRDPMHATSRGTGELIAVALDRGYRRLIVGVGGSAMVDGGTGALEALGVRLLDAHGRRIPPGGGGLAHLTSIDFAGLDPRLRETEILVPCDVDNPLCGPRGAAPTFGPQKGADPAMVAELAANLERLATLLSAHLGRDVSVVPFGGAGGGLSAALLACGSAELRPGIDLVLELLDFDRHLGGTHLVLTGEGKLDATSWGGKGPIGVAMASARHGVPCAAIVGQVEFGADVRRHGMFSRVVSLADTAASAELAMRDAYPLLAHATARLIRSLAPAS